MSSSPAQTQHKVLCIVYVSESRPAVIQQLLQHASALGAAAGGTRLVHSFCDTFYNRTSFFFVDTIQQSSGGDSGSFFLQNLLSFVSTSYSLVDKIDVANHPNIGNSSSLTRHIARYRQNALLTHLCRYYRQRHLLSPGFCGER